MRGNRGLNTQHVTDGIGTRCEGRQDKTNGKWKMENGSVMARRSVTSTAEQGEGQTSVEVVILVQFRRMQ
jgi:hypothetical protein